MPDALPEIREADASPDIAALYAEIRREMRVPLVNLIYRHLATIPGALPWVWALLGGPAASGMLDRAQESVAAMAPRFSNAPMAQGAPVPSGLGAADREAIRSLLDSYNRSNLLNLTGLTAIRTRLHRPAQDAAATAPTTVRRGDPAPDAVASAPPLPRLSELPEASAAAVRALASRHAATDRGVTPSLYLHLAGWPGLLAAVQDRLEPLFAGQVLEGYRDEVLRLTAREAGALLPHMPSEAPPEGSVPAIERALATFTRHVIPDMIPVGFTLRRWM